MRFGAIRAKENDASKRNREKFQTAILVKLVPQSLYVGVGLKSPQIVGTMRTWMVKFRNLSKKIDKLEPHAAEKKRAYIQFRLAKNREYMQFRLATYHAPRVHAVPLGEVPCHLFGRCFPPADE